MGQISSLDEEADVSGLSSAGWSHRYELEGLLMHLHQQAEIYWKQRGSINRVLEGDSPTAYFFAIANGRRRRCSIESLVIDGTKVVDPHLIMDHIFNFFSSLLAAKLVSGLIPSPNLWTQDKRVSEDENAALIISPSAEDIEMAINSANVNSASGPDSFTIPFFKRFWPSLCTPVCKIIQGFWLRTVDISHLNYVVLTLIPKVKGVDSISQFGPVGDITIRYDPPRRGRVIPMAIHEAQDRFGRWRFSQRPKAQRRLKTRRDKPP